MAKIKKQQKQEDQQQDQQVSVQVELENQLKRALADYQNLERRVTEERKLLSQLSSALVVEKFLPVLDNLEAAQQHLNDQGLSMVIKQFKDVLGSEGVEEIDDMGAQFDPAMHEAAEVVDGENDNVIVKVVAKGYKMEGRVIRPARVVVSKNSEATQQATEEGGLNV